MKANKAISLDNVSNRDIVALMPRMPETATHVAILTEKGKRARYVEISECLTDPENPAVLVAPISELWPTSRKGTKHTSLEWLDEPTTPRKAGKDTKKAKAPVPAAVTPAKAPKAKESTPEKQGKAKDAKATPAKAPKAPKDKPTPAPAKVKAKKDKPTPTPNTGFVAMVRTMLLDGKDGKSKYTIQAMCDAVLAKFPDKAPHSVKRIGYNLSKLKGVKWKSSVINTGYLQRIDELLFAGQTTTRLIGELVSVEFGKDPVSAKNVVRARLQVLRGMGHDVQVPLEDTDTRQLTYLPVTEA